MIKHVCLGLNYCYFVVIYVVDPANAQQASRVQSYFYVYEPENDSECKAVRVSLI